MTSYSTMALRGQIESAAKTTGRRKVVAERIEYDPAASNVAQFPGTPMARTSWVLARLVGACGHTLRSQRLAVPEDGAPPQPRYYLTGKVGRRMTCMHDDCKIPPKPVREPRADDCTFIIGTDPDPKVGRRCRTRAKWDTGMGALCTRHRDYLLDGGYLDDEGTEIQRPTTTQENRP
jgi:hypothetical protein